MAKKPKVKLTGKDGNVFNLIGICRNALRKAGQPTEAEQLMRECFAAESYSHALQIMAKYCEIS